MKHDYDVIVVGGRVAGASTAMLLARRGHRVLVVDRATMPSDTVSTHAVLRSGVLQLLRWGLVDGLLAAGTPPVRHTTLGFGSERISFPVREEYGIEALYAPRRQVLDALLLEAAVESGVDFAGDTRMTDVIREAEGRVGGVSVSRSRAVVDITARMVVGADGVSSRTADRVGAPAYAHHEPTNAIHYAYYEGVDTAGFWFQFTPGVNAGLIPTNGGEVCVFTGRPAGRMGAWRADPENEFRRLLRHAGPDLAERVADGTRVTQYRGTTGLPGFIRRPWGPGWALVGDAGYTKDPISAHGISDALRDAELCARAVDRALRQPDATVEAMWEYQRMRDALSRPMFEQSRSLAAHTWDAAEASAGMRIVSQAVRDECEALLALPAWAPIPQTVPA